MPDSHPAEQTTATGSGEKGEKRSAAWSLAAEGPDTAAAAVDEAAPPGSAFRLAAVGALLIVVLFAGYGLGRLNNGPATAGGQATTAGQAPAGGQATAAGQAPAGGQGTAGGPAAATAVDESKPHTHGATAPIPGAGAGAAVGGLSLSSSGLTLTPVTTTFPVNKRQKLEFTVNVPGGAPVTTYSVVHDKPLHLIVIRRDLTGFQHLHPVMASDGTWSIDLTLAQPGSYRMIADFTALVGGSQIATTLGSDLTVAGDYAPVALPDPARAAATSGFQVTYEGGPGTQSTQPLLMTVADRSGRPVAVEPYLGAYGHLVVLREGDTGYVHVHPETQLVDGKVKFWLAAPSPGTYRMFFDFQVAGKVSTAAWIVVVS